MNKNNKQTERKYSKHVQPEDESIKKKENKREIDGGRERKTEHMLK